MLNAYLQVAKKSLTLHLHLGPSRMAAAAIFWLNFLNNRSSIQSFFEKGGQPRLICIGVYRGAHVTQILPIDWS